MTRYTDGSYLAANPTWHAEDSSWKLTHVKHALRAARLNHIHTICDVGCGSGALIKQWAQEEPTVSFTGYDISPQALKICNQQMVENAIFVGGSEMPSGPFDLALALDVLEHVEQEEPWLDNLASRTQFLVLHIPLERSIYTWIRPGFIEEERRLMGHVHFYTPGDVEKMFKKHHLKILAWHYTNKYIEVPAELKTWKSKLGMKIRRLIHQILPHRLAAVTVGGYSVMCIVTRDTANEAI